MVFCEPGLFLRHDPAGELLPLIVDVSRSGREYPNDMRSPLPFSVIHDNVSMWLDDLYASAPQHGATLLFCSIAHMYVDMNRAETDFDPVMEPMALIGDVPQPPSDSRVARAKAVRAVLNMGRLSSIAVKWHETCCTS